MAIELTDSAAQHIESMLAQHTQATGLRLGIRKSGCNGHAYVVDYANEIGVQDTVLESRGIRIVVDKNSLPFLDGMTVDYVRNNALNEGLEFINPNATGNCGCGESISFGETAL